MESVIASLACFSMSCDYNIDPFSYILTGLAINDLDVDTKRHKSILP